MSKGLHYVWHGMLRVQEAILFICSILLIFGIAGQALFRYFIGISFFGLEEFIMVFAFWLYFIGASYGSHNKAHISAEVIPMYIKNEKFRKLFVLVVSLITIGISVLFTSWSYIMVSWTMERGPSTALWNIPLAVSQVVILISFILMTFYFVVHFIDDAKKFYKEELIAK